MGFLVSLSEQKGYIIFLNLSFVSVTFIFSFIHFYSSEFHVLSKSNTIASGTSDLDCKSFQSLDDYKNKCFYLKSNNPCVSQGYIDYLYIFYCNFGSFPFVGYSLLFLWLLVLFYLLGTTASEYFCSSLESFSKLLKLSPTIAGVTLLSLGNGAPDVFASLVAFMGSGTCEIALNTVLGSACFVTCVVVGTISISLRRRRIRVNRSAFIRDVCFFLLVILSLTLILIYGHINLLGSIGILFLYVVYVMVVYISHVVWMNDGKESEQGRDASSSSYGSDLRIPILSDMENEGINYQEEADLGVNKSCFGSGLSPSWLICFRILEMPLDLPRRLTIPVISEEKWSRPFAVASVSLAPILLTAIWTSQNETSTFKTKLVINWVGLLTGVFFGILALVTTKNLNPPKKWLFPWLAGGFLMSVTWSYITAQELVGLLVSTGFIIGISPSILGLTVLAWGNSLGDMVTNLTMALNDGKEGAQVAFSGCYAGPIFNMVFGLGISLVGSCWLSYPSPVVIPSDPYLLETLGFLVLGLLWTLLVLPKRDMKLDGVLGGGLLAVYSVSLVLRLMQTHVY